eukprot:gene14841-14977_t
MALQIEQVSHAYGVRQALSDVSFSVASGSFTVLLGLNGAGKSTLFSLITRLYATYSGKISIFGYDISRNPGAALAQLGVVFQSRALDADISVRQNLIYHAALHGIGRRDALRLTEEALSHVDLLDRLNEPVGKADILKHVRQLLLRENIGILWATHLMDEAGPQDDVVVLHKGRVLAHGAVAAVARACNTPDLSAAFSHLTQGDWRGFTFGQYWICLTGIVWREALRFIHQRERFLSALVRPLVWLFIFAAGFRQVLGVSIIPPYETYVLYEVYITPGLIAMIQLFNGMQSSLTMVYDRETGGMRTLLVSPFPRWFLLSGKLLAGTCVSILQVYAYLVIAWFWDIAPPPLGYLTILPALVLTGLMLGALGMLISSLVKQLENFSGVMNFVIFPMFFASSALYPLWRVRESSPFLYYICQINPFSHATELIRFAFYMQISWIDLSIVASCTLVFLVGAIIAYDPARGFLGRS